MIPGGLLLSPLILLLLFPLLLVSFLQDLISVTDIYVGLETLNYLLPIDGKLKFGLLLELPESTKHGRIAFLQLFCIDLKDFLNRCWLSRSLQCTSQHVYFLAQLFHFVPGLCQIIETQTGQKMSPHDTYPLIHCLHQVSAHIIHTFQSSSAKGIEIKTGRVMLSHQCSDMFQFGIHLSPHLLDTADLRNDIGLTVQLQVLPNTLRAQQLHTLQTKMTQDLVGMVLTIRSSESWSILPHCTGSRQK